MRRAALPLLVAACSFDATGQTGAGGGGAGVGTTTGTGAVTTTAEPGTSGGPGVTTGGVGMSGTTAAVDPTTGAGSSTGPATTTLPPATTGGEETTSDETTMAPDPSTTTGTGDETTGDGCPGPVVKILELVADADLEFPMELEQSGVGEGTIATSAYPEVGTVEFTVDIPCAGEYAVWARVYDGDPGVHDFSDPDSYYVRVDGGPELTWFYGCQTEGANQAWSWLRTRGVGDDCGDFTDWTLPLAPGPHVIRFRNRESQTNGGTRAAIARILVTDDPGYVPTLE